MKRLKTVFMGTPDFAVPCLTRLMDVADVVAVVTQPDKPRGRGHKMTPSAVKVAAQFHDIPVYQPERIRDENFVSILDVLSPDLIVVVAFGQILSQRILDIPAYGCINVHASLLPKYRGAAPMQRCLMAGESVTGVTTMMMDAGLDTGDMLLREEVAIGNETSFEELHDKLSAVGAELLVSTIKLLGEGKLKKIRQDNEASSYAAMLTKETGRIDWKRSASEIHNLVRALDSWPGAYTTLDGTSYKIWRTRVLSEETIGTPGEVLQRTDCGPVIATGAGTLEILELQAPGKKRMKAADYLRGHPIAEHSLFR